MYRKHLLYIQYESGSHSGFIHSINHYITAWSGLVFILCGTLFYLTVPFFISKCRTIKVGYT